MIKITFRQKIALELYSNLSLLSAIIILLFYTFSGRIKNDLYPYIISIIFLFSIVFIYFLRTLINDVNSIEFDEDINKYESKVVNIKGSEKVTLEFFSTLSNAVIVAVIIIFGISETKGPISEILSIIFIVIFSIPIIFLIKYIVFDLNLILRKKKQDDNFFIRLINRKTLALLVIILLIVVFFYSSNVLFTSIKKTSERSLVFSGITTFDISSKISITKISGERKQIQGAPITLIHLYLETTEMKYYINSAIINFINETTTSKLEYGINADGSHFSYKGKNGGKDNTILEVSETGIITINLSSTGQELYSNKNGTIQLIQSNGKMISKEIKAPELKEEAIIQLYSK